MDFVTGIILTLIIETIALLYLLSSARNLSKSRIVTASLVANIITYVLAWFIISGFIYTNNPLMTITLQELFAWIVEALLYIPLLKISFKRTLLISLLANLTSFSLGLIIASVFGL